MKILIHDYCGHPFQVQLSRSLAHYQHEVLHVFSASDITPHGALIKKNEDPNTLSILGIKISKPFQKYNLVKRRQQEREYGHLVAEIIINHQPNCLISANTPLEAQNIIMKTCQAENIPIIYWLQDFLGIGTHRILKEKLPVIGYLIGTYYKWLERNLLKKSYSVVVITDDFKEILLDYSIPEKCIHTIENWAPLNELTPQPKDNPWSRKHNLHDKFCFLYSGTLGLKHNPNLLLQLALHFKNNENVRIIVLTEGLGAEWLRKKKKQMKVDNLILKDFQPYELLPYVLASGDVLIAILEPDAGVFSVPSKVLTYLCAIRPLLLSIPSENLAARIVKEYDMGLIVEPNDSAGFIQAAEQLVNDNELRVKLGNNAIKYAKNNFDIEIITNKFENIITSIN